jgi:2-phospho-L-lactate guanylyltransferase
LQKKGRANLSAQNWNEIVDLKSDIWAVLPIKNLEQAKKRLSKGYPPEMRRGLAAVMAEDVLAALAATKELAGILVVTDDPQATVLAKKYGCTISIEATRAGHTAAVAAAARRLADERRGGILVVPGDIPLVTHKEISILLAAHAQGMGFSISPAHDERGSNAIVCSPPGLIPLTYGNDSYFPHLSAARAKGFEPVICPLLGIGLDIDHPEDLAKFMARPSKTRTWDYLYKLGLTGQAEPSSNAKLEQTA